MAAATAAAASTMSLLPISQLRQQQHGAGAIRRRPWVARRRRYVVPTARLFGPAIFEASKLKVLFLGVDKAGSKQHGHPAPPPPPLPRTYTLTHSDVTASLTLAVSHTINRAQLQGWYNRLQRDEVVAEWKKVRGRMSLHVHCHISGGHFLLDLIAGLRYIIFRKELPVVLKAFVHGDGDLLSAHHHQALHQAQQKLAGRRSSTRKRGNRPSKVGVQGNPTLTIWAQIGLCNWPTGAVV